MDKQQKKQERDWTNLPIGILDLILQRLDNTIPHRTRLRSVCSSWRTSVSPNNPLTPLPPFLTQSSFYLIYDTVNKTNAWLTRVSEPLYNNNNNNNNNHWSLLNPMSPETNFTPMPDIKGTTVSLFDNNVTQVATAYSVVGNDLDDVVKVVLFPITKQDAVCLLALFEHGGLKLWKTGDNENEWKSVNKDGCRYLDVIVFEDEFYVVDVKGQLMVINPETYQTRDVNVVTLDMYPSPMTAYLVVSGGELYLVNKQLEPGGYYYIMPYLKTLRLLGEPDRGPSLEVSRYKPKDMTVCVLSRGESGLAWEPALSLDDKVFFVSSYVTFSVSGKELGWKRGDRVIFGDDWFKGHKCQNYVVGADNCGSSEHSYTSILQMFSQDGGIFDVPKKVIKCASGFPLPSAYKIFWPVPKWLVSA